MQRTRAGFWQHELFSLWVKRRAARFSALPCCPLRGYWVTCVMCPWSDKISETDVAGSTHGELQTWSRVLLQELLVAQLGNEFPEFLWNTNFHYCAHKLWPPTHILSQINPAPVLSSYFFKIRLVISSHLYLGTCHNHQAYPQAAGADDGFQVWEVAANTLIMQWQ